jgi:hypothetical protein
MPAFYFCLIKTKSKLNLTTHFTMKHLNLSKILFLIAGCLALSISAMSCSKDSTKPGNNGGDYGTHHIDPQLAGDWMWTSGSDIGYYDDNGVFQGSGYGFATKVAVDAKGNGTLFNHVFSDLGYGSKLVVDIYYNGYYEMDDQGNLNFYPMSGTYKSSSGTNRALRPDELYNPSTGGGRIISYPAVNFTTANRRECFTITYSASQETDYFYKL